MKPLNIDGIKKDLYFIEEDGRIYSKTKKRFLSPQKDKDGYLYIGLQRADEKNKRIYKRIAFLVIYTYVGPPPESLKDPTINHIDGDKTNNHYTNLEWLERGINSSIRKNRGQGVNNHEAILTEQEVREICDLLLNTNLTYKEIADKFFIEESMISKIANKKNWKHITNQFDFSCRQIIRNEKGQYKVINLNSRGDSHCQ